MLYSSLIGTLNLNIQPMVACAPPLVSLHLIARLLMILLSFEPLLAVYSIFFSQDLTSLLPLTDSHSLYIVPLWFILKLSNKSCFTLLEQLPKVSSFPDPRHVIFMLTQMRIGLEIMMITLLRLLTLSILANNQFRGVLRN